MEIRKGSEKVIMFLVMRQEWREKKVLEWFHESMEEKGWEKGWEKEGEMMEEMMEELMKV